MSARRTLLALLLAPLALLLAALAPACRPAGEAALPVGHVTIQGETVEVEIARDGPARARGLSGRAGLAPGRGMLFLHEVADRHPYWMKDMRFEIDILWLRGGRVVDVAHRVPPPPPGTAEADLPLYAPGAPADAVLEVPAGFAHQHGWSVGQEVILEPPAP